MIEADENNKMRVWMLSLAAIFLATVVCCRCSSPAPPPEAVGEVPAVEPAAQPQEEPPQPEPPQELPPQEVPPEEEPPQEEPPQEEAEPEPVEEYVVSEDVYTKTFDEIEKFIYNLNEIIRREDYDTWLTYLSDEYIERTSDPAYLREQSEQPLLKKNGIVLDSLRDYFEYVVVPSRTQAKLDEIEFIDENQVRAYAMIKNTKALLYLLVREDDKWKIGVW